MKTDNSLNFEKLNNNLAESYFNVLELLSKSTDDYLFYCDMSGSRIRFFGDINEKYALGGSDNDYDSFDALLKVVHPADREILKAEFNLILSGEKDVHDVEYRWITKAGESVWLSCRGKVVRADDGSAIAMVGRVSHEALRHLYNPLTGLFNQLRLIPDLKKYLAEKTYNTLMLVDIDDLSVINLSHGRKHGDNLLKLLASELEKISSASAVYHAERNYFAVCLNTSGDEETMSIYKKICSSLNDKCTVSAGIVPIDSLVFADESSLFDSAKVILRKAKLKGKNDIEFYSSEEIKKKISSVELIEEFTESINNDYRGFYLTFQPQLKAGNYDIFCAEALLRYTSKSGKLIYPDVFIPVLEQSGLINSVGLWVLKTALIQCREWRKFHKDMRISVNFSIVQLKDEYIVDKVLGVLEEVDMPGSALTIEITESIPALDMERLSDVIFHFKTAGIQIAIDDFGTGYSNLAYLKNLDVDEIKIDRMFVKDIQEDTYNFRLVSNTMDFAKSNSIRICCEGVETAKELAVLETRSPDLFQGYLFDKPCSAEEITQSYINSDSLKYQDRSKFLEELYKYKESYGSINFDPRDILRETDVGLWIIRVNKAEGYSELYVDDTMEKLMSIDKKYSPRECYDYWISKVSAEYTEYIHKNLEHMQSADKVVQLQYKWIHPELGEVLVRSSGRHVKDADGFVIIEGYHKIMENIEEA